MKLLAVLIAAALAPIATNAQAQTQPTPATVTVVHAGVLIHEPGTAPKREATIVIRDGRIESVRDGYADGASIAANATVVDLRDYTVLPGLIDSHVHLATSKAGVAGQLSEISRGIAAYAYDAAENANRTLDAGFTTVRNLGDSGGVTLALRDAINAGQMRGPRIIDAGTSISTTAGHMDPTLGYRDDLHDALNVEENLCDGADDCRKAVRRQIGRGVDVIKIATTGGVNSRIGAGLGKQMFDDEAKAIVETAHLYGKKVAVHAHGADGVNLALASGADSIEHGTLLDDEGVKLFKQSGAYYVPTLSTVNGYLERIKADPNAYAPDVRKKIDWRIGITGKALALAAKHGVKIAFGTDAGVSMHGRNADEFELMVKHGMTPAEALRAATVNAADLLGVANDAGTLAAGKSADLIAVRGNPLDDVTVLKNVAVVMRDGRIEKDARTTDAVD